MVDIENSRHRRTGTDYTAPYLVEAENSPRPPELDEMTPAEQALYHRERSLLQRVNQIDDAVAALPSFWQRSYEPLRRGTVDKEVSWLQSRFAKRRNTLTGFTRINNDRIAANPGLAGGLASQQAAIIAEQTELGNILSYLEKVSGRGPTDNDYFHRSLLLDMGKRLGHAETAATASELEADILLKINEAMEVITKGNSNLGMIHYPVKYENPESHATHSENLNVAHLWEYFHDSHLFRDYGGSIWGSIFGFSNWRFGARKLKVLTMENYEKLEPLEDALRKANMETVDANANEIIEGALLTKDGFEVPAIERMRAAVLLYDKMGQIKLIQMRDSVTVDRDRYLLSEVDDAEINGFPLAERAAERSRRILAKRAALGTTAAIQAEIEKNSIEKYDPDKDYYLLSNAKRRVIALMSPEVQAAEVKKQIQEKKHNVLMNDKTRIAKEILKNKADLLRLQPNLEWLTQEEAEFLIVNVQDISPWEKITRDQLYSTRRAIQLFCAADAIRNSTSRVNTFDGILTGDLRIKAESSFDSATKENSFKKTIYTYKNDVEITFGDDTETDNPPAEIKYKGAVVLLSGLPTALQAEVANLVGKLAKMRKYGERMEGGAFDMYYPSLAFEASGDSKTVWAFATELGTIANLRSRVTRFAYSSYRPPVSLTIAQSMPYLISTWWSQAEYRSNAKSMDGKFVEEPRSIINVFGDPNFDAQAQFIPQRNIAMGEAYNMSFNIKRAKDLFAMVQKDIFSQINFQLATLGHLGASKKDSEASYKHLNEGLQTVYKAFKDLVDRFNIYEGIEGLVANDEVKLQVRQWVLELQNAERDGNRATMKQLKERIQFQLVKNMMESYILEGVANYFASLPVEYSRTGDDNKDRVGWKNAVRSRTDDVRRTLETLKRTLVTPGTIRSGAAYDNGQNIPLRFINDKTPIQDIFDPTHSSTSEVADLFEHALEEAFVTTVLASEQSEPSAFDLKIKT